MNVTVRKIGNSEGVILPKEVLEGHNLKAGDQLELIETAEGLTLMIPSIARWKQPAKSWIDIR